MPRSDPSVRSSASVLRASLPTTPRRRLFFFLSLMIGWDLRSRPVAVKRALGWTATDGSVDPVAERCSIGVLVLVLDLRLHLTLPQSSLSAREPKGERERESVCVERGRGSAACRRSSHRRSSSSMTYVLVVCPPKSGPVDYIETNVNRNERSET